MNSASFRRKISSAGGMGRYMTMNKVRDRSNIGALIIK